MHFWKYCGAGNDFVILENFDGSIAPERYAVLAAILCQEHFSIGADGLMWSASVMSRLSFSG